MYIVCSKLKHTYTLAHIYIHECTHTEYLRSRNQWLSLKRISEVKVKGRHTLSLNTSVYPEPIKKLIPQRTAVEKFILTVCVTKK